MWERYKGWPGEGEVGGGGGRWWVVPVSDWDAWWERDNGPLSLVDICLSHSSSDGREGWESQTILISINVTTVLPTETEMFLTAALLSPENRERARNSHISHHNVTSFLSPGSPAMPCHSGTERNDALMLCTVIYSFYQHRGRWGVFVFDTPVLQFSSSFPYWATFNLPSAGLQLNVKHPGGTKTASLDLNISRDPWPHQAPPCQVPHHQLCFTLGMWKILKSGILHSFVYFGQYLW